MAKLELYDAQPVYDELAATIKKLGEQAQAAGIQFVMLFEYSHQHDEQDKCSLGRGMYLNVDSRRASELLVAAAKLAQADNKLLSVGLIQAIDQIAAQQAKVNGHGPVAARHRGFGRGKRH